MHANDIIIVKTVKLPNCDFKVLGCQCQIILENKSATITQTLWNAKRKVIFKGEI